MGFLAEPNSELHEYIIGDDYRKYNKFEGIYHESMSISSTRYDYLQNLDWEDPSFKISLRDPINDLWKKWEKFPGILIETKKNNYGIQSSRIGSAIDVHRSILQNEIVIESDYPTYEENYEASKIIGVILENKGFIPHYYYSGNKSIHIHIFLDKSFLEATKTFLDESIGIVFSSRQKKLIDRFMEWIRKKMITCWDTNAKEFDKDLIKATHLIRAELSKNKRGFKTFLGYTHKDLSFIPYICNEKNKIYPKLAKIRTSFPKDPIPLLKEFIEEFKTDKQFKQTKKKNTLTAWIGGSPKDDLRGCVKAILSEDFKKVKDGIKRSMFILVNELRSVYADAEAKAKAHEWNESLGNPIRGEDINYRFKQRKYTLTCSYIHNFLKDIGFDVSQQCKRKV